LTSRQSECVRRERGGKDATFFSSLYPLSAAFFYIFWLFGCFFHRLSSLLLGKTTFSVDLDGRRILA
jgi:hypothetical protein